MTTRYLTQVQAEAFCDLDNSYDFYKLSIYDVESEEIKNLKRLQALYVKTLSDGVLSEITSTRVHKLALKELSTHFPAKTSRHDEQLDIKLIEFTIR